MKQIIGLTESELRNIVKNTILRVINHTHLADGIYEITDERKIKLYSKQIKTRK